MDVDTGADDSRRRARGRGSCGGGRVVQVGFSFSVFTCAALVACRTPRRGDAGEVTRGWLAALASGVGGWYEKLVPCVEKQQGGIITIITITVLYFCRTFASVILGRVTSKHHVESKESGIRAIANTVTL